ncbi:MAG: hypothetical protein C4576_28460 [Desulfobacteraceae bacterium]|nr:MAG: hypothetical protein C4576_28460 [Desulfobacteraceae bacterium]
MKSGKWNVFITTAVLSVFLFAGAAPAADRAEVLKRTADKLTALYGEKDFRDMMEGVELFKKAGLSYQPSLVYPLEGIIECKDKTQLQTLLGIYLFDLNYAMVFGKTKEAAATNAVVVDIVKRLKLDEKVKPQILSADDLKRIAEKPNDPAGREIFIKYMMSNMRGLVTAAQSDPEVLESAVNAVMGATFMSLYVASELGLASGSGEKLVTLFNEQSSRMKKAQQIIESLLEDPGLAEFAKSSMRAKNLEHYLGVVMAKKGNMDESDLKKILSRTRPYWQEFSEKCK